MALINCPECRSSISDKAASCPQCGYPVRKTEYTVEEVVERGSTVHRQQLDELLSKGWQIIDSDDSDTWVDGDGYQCRRIKYRLRR